MEDYTFDLEKVVKSVKGAEKIPGFVLDWAKKIVHLDFFNDYLAKGYEGGEFCDKALEYFDVKLDVRGSENLDLVPEGKHVIWASNHPMGGMDGVALLGLMYRKYGEKIKFLVNNFLTNIKGLVPVSIPVNKFGGQPREFVQVMNEAYDSDNEILIFPAGVCSQKKKGVIKDLDWKKNFISQSVRSGRYVVPVHMVSENSKRYYRVSNFANTFKIKLPLTTLVLPDELYKTQHKTFQVVIGKPIPPETFDKGKSPVEWAAWVREKVYKL